MRYAIAIYNETVSGRVRDVVQPSDETKRLIHHPATRGDNTIVITVVAPEERLAFVAGHEP